MWGKKRSSWEAIRTVWAKDDGDGEIFGIGYNDIMGFEPRVGVSYKIKVRQEIDQNTNQPTGYWHLEEILSQNVSR